MDEKTLKLRTFTVAECCLNCVHRKSRIDKNVVCSLDEQWYSERVKCEFYERTKNGAIGAGEKPLLERARMNARKGYAPWLKVQKEQEAAAK